MMTQMRALAFFGMLLVAAPAWAHRPSDTILRLDVDGAQVIGRWDIAVRDLDAALGLDDDGDGAIVGRELRGHAAAIAAYAAPRLAIDADGASCPLAIGGQRLVDKSDGAYLELELRADCPAPAQRLGVGYSLLFDIDPRHRGLASVAAARHTESAVLRAGAARHEFTLHTTSTAAELAGFVVEGVLHIWAGVDHILFLIALLLPTVLGRRKAGVLDDQLASTFIDVAKLVTAFTVAHSITLALAGLGLVRLPTRFVETAIAVTVVLAALQNLRAGTKTRWSMAFCLGLLHGFGFSNVLGDLGASGAELGLSLLGFNLGVECGQAAIVVVFLPIAYAMRRTWFYRRAVVVLGSVLIAAVALAWAVERATSL